MTVNGQFSSPFAPPIERAMTNEGAGMNHVTRDVFSGAQGGLGPRAEKF